MIASDVSGASGSLRPVFIGRLHLSAHPAWPGEVWVLPARTNVAPGDFLFTIDGALAGLVIRHGDTPALVPGETVRLAADRLLREEGFEAGWLGIEVQALTPTLAAASGARAGVMIVSVNPDGPAAERFAVMDVVEAIGGEPIVSPEDWRARTARLAPGESVVLRVRRHGESIDVPLTLIPPPHGPLPLGLSMRTIRQSGAEIVRIAGRSSAKRAGLREGDVITAIGKIQAPSPSQIERAFAAAPDDGTLLVAITRGETRHVLALRKQ